MRLIQLSKC